MLPFHLEQKWFGGIVCQFVLLDDIGVFLLNTIWRKEGKCTLPLSVYSGAKYRSVLYVYLFQNSHTLLEKREGVHGECSQVLHLSSEEVGLE